jgi:hypothetical protein
LVVAIAWMVMLVRARKNKKADKWIGSAPKDDKDVEIIEA